MEDAVQILSKVFEDSGASFRYIFCHLSEEEKNAALPDFFRTVFTAAALNNATFDFLDHDNCCGVLLPPGSGREVGNPVMLLHERLEGVDWAIGQGAASRLLGALERPVEAAKANLFGRADRFYSVLLAGTKAEARGKGLCSALIRHYQGVAAERGLPILLHTNSERALRLYTRYGFEIVENTLTGKGTCDAEGRKEEGGPGITGWALLWRPTMPS